MNEIDVEGHGWVEGAYLKHGKAPSPLTTFWEFLRDWCWLGLSLPDPLSTLCPSLLPPTSSLQLPPTVPQSEPALRLQTAFSLLSMSTTIALFPSSLLMPVLAGLCIQVQWLGNQH